MLLNLGIIGTGSAVRRLHWPVLQKMPNAFRVVAVANRTPAKAEELAQEIGCAKVYDHYQALLDDPEVDAVLTAVPVALNSQVLIDAILAGKHVLAEKPIAATLVEAQAVLRACKNTSKVVAIAENFRYREDVAKARELIAGGAIGGVSCFQMSTQYDVSTAFRRPWFESGTWRHTPTYPGGMITDTSIHAISSLREILGEVKELYAQVLHTSSVTEGSDSVVAQLTMTNGAVGHYLACYTAKVAKESVFDFTAFGNRGSLQLTEGEVAWLPCAGSQVLHYRPEGYDRGYTRQWRNFYGAVCGEETLLSTSTEGFRDLLVIDAMLRSAASRKVVQLDYADEVGHLSA